MANREKGEVSVEIAGTSYTLYLDLNAMALLEDYFSTPNKEVEFDYIVQRVNAGSIRHIRAFFWAALQKYHPTITVQRAGELIMDGGGLELFGNKLLALQTTAQPDAEDLRALGVNTKNPQQAQAGRKRRGGISTSTHVS